MSGYLAGGSGCSFLSGDLFREPCHECRLQDTSGTVCWFEEVATLSPSRGQMGTMKRQLVILLEIGLEGSRVVRYNTYIPSL
jgi:hypothetical protein